MKIAFPSLLLMAAAATSLAGEISPLPDKVPSVVADRQDAQVPDRVQLKGMLGVRIHNSAVNRLLAIDLDRLLEGFRKRPGRQTYDGEHVGKWLHAATLAWVYTGNADLRAKLDHAVGELLKCQLDDGYLGTYLPKKRWTEWDVWSHKYNLIGLIDLRALHGQPRAAVGVPEDGRPAVQHLRRRARQTRHHRGRRPRRHGAHQRAGADGVALSPHRREEVRRLLSVYSAILGTAQRAAHRLAAAGVEARRHGGQRQGLRDALVHQWHVGMVSHHRRSAATFRRR